MILTNAEEIQGEICRFVMKVVIKRISKKKFVSAKLRRVVCKWSDFSGTDGKK